jgi:hypothetical protein
MNGEYGEMEDEMNRANTSTKDKQTPTGSKFLAHGPSTPHSAPSCEQYEHEDDGGKRHQDIATT